MALASCTLLAWAGLAVGVAHASDGWAPQDSGTSANLSSVEFVDADTGWAVGANGTIVHTADGGATWTSQSSGTAAQLSSVCFIDANIGWAVGNGGTILATADGGAHWSPQASNATRDLYGVAFIDANTGWAVGESTDASVLFTSDGGTTWEKRGTGASVPFYPYYSVAFADENTVLITSVMGHMYRFTDASGFEDVGGGGHDMYSVCFPDANTGWAVGIRFFVGGVILRTTDGGADWVSQTSGTAEALRDVASVDANTGWAVGDSGTILTTTDGGAHWSAQVSSTSANLSSVDFIDADTGWAVGAGGTILATDDGGGHEVSPPTTLLSVAPSSPDGLSGYYVSAPTITLSRDEPGTTYYRWDATPTVGSQTTYSSPIVAPDGEHTLYWYSVDSVENTETVRSQAFKVDTTDPSPVTLSGNAVSESRVDLAWTVSSDTGSGIDYYKVERVPLSDTSANLSSVDFVDADTGWAVGANGTIVHTADGGATWTSQSSGTAEQLSSVCFVDANTGWAVGHGGTILATADGGAHWSPQASNVTRRLYGVAFIDANTGWAVGEAGDGAETTRSVLFTSDGGTTWEKRETGAAYSYQYYSVAFADENTVWIASVMGYMRWLTVGEPWGGGGLLAAPGASFYSVCFPDANTGWAVGYVNVGHGIGVILRTTDGGTNWVSQTSGTEEALSDVASVDANTGWVVGDSGTILKTADGGAHWSPQSSSTSANLSSVDFIDADTGWAVGAGGTILATDDGGQDWLAAHTTAKTTFSDVGLSPLTEYQYRVRAVDAAGNTSAASGLRTVTTLAEGAETPPPTTTISFAPLGPDGANGWYVTQPTVTLTRDKVGSTYYQFDATTTAGWTTYDMELAVPEGEHTLYYYSVDSVGNTETGRQCSGIKTDTSDPSAVTASVSTVGSSTAELSWSASSDLGSGLAGYRVYRQGEPTPLATTAGTSTTLTGLSAGTAYALLVRAVDVAGRESPDSGVVAFTTDAEHTVAIGTGENVTASTPSGVVVTFDEITGSGTFGVTPSASPSGPPAFRILGSSYFNVTFSGTFAGSFTITLPYDESELQGASGSNVKLFHYKDGAWEDITISVDTVSNTVTGRTDTFSGFGVGAPTAGGTTSTPTSSWWSVLLLAVAGIGLLGRAGRRGSLRSFG